MKFCPHKYQKDCIDFVIRNPKCNLFLEMGLGKSAICLSAIRDLLFDSIEVHKVLIVAPLRVATVSWPAEIQKWDLFKDFSYYVLYGPNRTEEPIEADIIITTYETLEHIKRNPLCVQGVDMVIFDESTYIKNEQSHRWQRAFSVLGLVERTVMLTGTPMPNGLADMWAPMYMLDYGKRLGVTRSIYRDLYFDMGGYNGRKYIPRKGAVDRVMDKIKDISKTLKAKDYLDLPELIINKVPVKLGVGIRIVYADVEKKFFTRIADKIIKADSAAAKSMKLRQLTQGFIYDEHKEAYKIGGVDKINALKEIQSAYPNENKIIVSNFVHEVESLSKLFVGASIYGPTSTQEGKERIEQWNKGNLKNLIVYPGSVAHGINLQDGGRMIIWMGPTWNLEHWLQMNARLHRQGQTKPVIVHVLVATETVEEVIFQGLKGKFLNQEALLNGLIAYWENRQ